MEKKPDDWEVIEEIKKLVKKRYPHLALAKLEIWSEGGTSKFTKKIHYGQWLCEKTAKKSKERSHG